MTEKESGIIERNTEFSKEDTTNYEPNMIDWKVGDLVIHDVDAKEYNCLMVVTKIQKNGLILTKYKDPYIGRTAEKVGKMWLRYMIKKRWKNDKKYLHDPRRFDMNVRNQ